MVYVFAFHQKEDYLGRKNGISYYSLYGAIGAINLIYFGSISVHLTRLMTIMIKNP